MEPPLARALGREAERTALASADQVDLGTVEIGLERTPCFGSCPSYRVTIRGDGSVSYFGDDYVRVQGERIRLITATAVNELLAQFDAAKFGDLDDEYVQEVTDDPSTYLTLVRDGRSKRVLNYWSQASLERIHQLAERGFNVAHLEVHRRLDALADAIDAAVQIEQWIGSDDERAADPGHFERLKFEVDDLRGR
jgi:hypothetical protein